MSKLLEELRTLPAFNAFEKTVNEKLTSENSYVEHFMPEVGEGWDDGYDEDGNREWHRCYTSQEQAEEDFQLATRMERGTRCQRNRQQGDSTSGEIL